VFFKRNSFIFFHVVLSYKKKENYEKVVSIVHDNYMTFETMLMLLAICNFIPYMSGVVFAMAMRLSN
jgi:hypothetical protein